MADLTIITSALPSAYAGDSYNHRVQARRGQTPYRWTATGLPSGLTIDADTGVVTTTAAGITAAQVGTYSAAITVTDLFGVAVTKTLTLVVRPANYRRKTTLMVDPVLQAQISVYDASQVTREQVTGHFAEGPRASVQMTPNGLFESDVFAHWAGQIGFAAGPPEASSPTSPSSPSPVSPGSPAPGSPSPSAGILVSAPVSSLYEVITDLQTDRKALAEPVIIDVQQYDALESPEDAVTAVGFSTSSGFLGDNLDVVLTEYTSGPLYDSPDFSIGYPAVAQLLSVPADITVNGLTLYGSRPSTNQVGGVIVAISTNAGSPGLGVHIPAGTYTSATGDGSALVARAYLSPGAFKVDASRTAWDETFAINVTFSPESPHGSSPGDFVLSGDTDYYLVISSDYYLSPGSPSDGYISIAASIDETVTSSIPGSVVYSVSASPEGSPFWSPYAVLTPSPVYAGNFDSSPKQDVTALGFNLEGVWAEPTVGVITLEFDDPFATGNDRYWVGKNTVNAATVRDTAFRIIDGYDRDGGSPVEDLTNFDEIIDAYGNQAEIVGVFTTSDVEVNPSAGGLVDTDGFLSTGGVKLKVSWTPNTRGAVPPVPFKVIAGRRRFLNDLDADALIRTANKTGSTDAGVLSAIASTVPSDPVLSLSQVEPDEAGNILFTVSSGGLSITKFSSASTLQFNLNATITAKETGLAGTAVGFDSTGTLNLVAGDFLSVTTNTNEIRLDADPGVYTLNSIEADGGGNLQLVAGADATHAGQVFVTFSSGTNSVVIGTNIPDATESAAGLMGMTDKQRLNELFSNVNVSQTATGTLSGGHTHLANTLRLGSAVSGYLNLAAGITIQDALSAINTALASQFTTASEAAALGSITTTYASFGSGYLSNGSSISYESPTYAPGQLVTNLVEGSAATVFRVTTNPFGDPGNSGTVGLQLSGGSPASWTTLEILDLTQTYSDAVAAIGGSPPNYTSVAAYMQSNPVMSGGSPTTKIDFVSVTYLGLDPSAAPVFEIKVQGDPVLADFPNALGYNKVRFYHDTGSTVRNSTEVELVKDQYAGAADPSISVAELGARADASLRYVSGIPHYVASEQIGLHIEAANLYNIAYQQNLLTVADLDDSATSITLPYYITDTASPKDATWIPSPAEVFTIGTSPSPYLLTQNMTFLVASDGYSSRSLALQYEDEFIEGSPGTTFAYADPFSTPFGRMLHMGRAGTSVGSLTVETFASEKYRIDPADWGGIDLVSPTGSPVFTKFVTQPIGGGTLEANTYGWPSGTPLTDLPNTNTWIVTGGSPSAEFRSGKTFTFDAATRAARPAQVGDLGLVHPGYNEATNYDETLQMPAISSPSNVYESYDSPYGYYDTYAAQSSVVYYRLFESGTAANQGRLRIYGYKRNDTSSPTLSSYESYSSPLGSPDFLGSWFNIGPSASPDPAYEGLSLEIKFVGDQSTIHAETPLGNPGKTGWMDMLTTSASSLYEPGEDGYGVLDTEGLVAGAGYVDVYWRAGSFTTGVTNNQAVLRLGLHGDEGQRIVITRMEMLDQSTDTAWSSGA